jgi:predicted amidophosphoribosyltransferase
MLDKRTYLCEKCVTSIEPVVSVQVPITKTVAIAVHALGRYESPLIELIRAKNHSVEYGAYVLGELLAQSISPEIIAHAILVPIPLHWTRYASRGFNQAELIASRIAYHHGVPVAPLLVRPKRTAFQALSLVADREKNVADAFLWNSLYDKDDYADNNYLLIDDLMTTGSTVAAAAKVLMETRPRKVSALVGARVC